MTRQARTVGRNIRLVLLSATLAQGQYDWRKQNHPGAQGRQVEDIDLFSTVHRPLGQWPEKTAAGHTTHSLVVLVAHYALRR